MAHRKASKKIRFGLYLIVLVVLLSGGSRFFTKVNAQTSGGNVNGWLWSDNVGWVSLNCADIGACSTSNYGVTINASTGVMSGYGWSDNVGWISFNTGSTACPAGSGCVPTVNLSTGAVTGYARFCAGTINGDCNSSDRTDGWTGWVQLSDATNANIQSPVFDGSKGVTYNPTTKAIVGYSWGGDVVGWLQFNRVTTTVSGTPVQCTINGVAFTPGTTIIRYSITRATSTAICDGNKITSVCQQTSPASAAWSVDVTPIANGNYPYDVCDGGAGTTGCPAQNNQSICTIPNSKGTVLGYPTANGTLTCGNEMKFYIKNSVNNNAAGTITCDSNNNSRVLRCDETGNFSNAGSYVNPVCKVNPYHKEK